MPLIKKGQQTHLIRTAVVLDLGDLHREETRARERAASEAREIITRARAERERLISRASEEGFAAGHERGMEEGRAEGFASAKEEALGEHRERLDALASAWTDALGAFAARRDEMLLDARTDVVRLAGLVAERVTKRVVDLDPGVVGEQMAAVLGVLARPARVVLTINPGDEPLARDALPGLLERFTNATDAELRTDPSLERGSCVATTGEGGLIEASIDAQLERMLVQLLPDRGQSGPRARLAGGGDAA